MSRWHREHPEKGNQVEPDSSAHVFMQADAMRKGELPRPDGLCAKHTEEHRRAQENGREWCRSAHNDPNHEVTACDSIQCPVCFNEANEKAYDRKARLAEHAEHLVRIARAYVVVVGSKAVDCEIAGNPTTAAIYHAARAEAEELLQRIEGDQ